MKYKNIKKATAITLIAITAAVNTLAAGAQELDDAKSEIIMDEVTSDEIQTEEKESFMSAQELTVLPPAEIKAEAISKNCIEVSFIQSENADRYYIYRKTGNSSFEKAAVIDAVEDAQWVTYTDENLAMGVEYSYRMKSIKETEEGRITSSFTDTVKTTCIPGKPEISVRSAAYNNVVIEWNTEDDTDITGYYIYRGDSKDGAYELVGNIEDGTAYFEDYNVTLNKTYYYKASAYVYVGRKKIVGEVSDYLKVKVLPGMPESFTAKPASYNSVKLTWKAVPGAQGYKVYRSDSKDGEFTCISTIKDAGTVSFKDTNLASGKEYYYRIKSYIKSGSKNIYSPYTEIMKAKPVLAKVKNLIAVPKVSNIIKLSWGPVTGAEKYNIYRAESEGDKMVKIAETTELTYSDSGLSAGQVYYYCVVGAAGGIDGSKASSVSAMAAKLTASDSKIELDVGEEYTVTVKASPSTENMEWSTSKAKVATVDENGKITAVAPGTAKISVTANDITRVITVEVKSKITFGIDVSKWQGNVDFDKVKDAGRDFVMLRVSYGGNQVDPYFEVNYLNARKAGLKVGAYVYSLAKTTDAAKQEAKSVLGILNGRTLDYPLCLDFEDNSIIQATTKAQRTDLIRTYEKAVTRAGYKFMLYASHSWLVYDIDNSQLDGIDIWVARYCDYSLGHRYTGGGRVAMWQYSDHGSVAGINGYVDLDECYIKY